MRPLCSNDLLTDFQFVEYDMKNEWHFLVMTPVVADAGVDYVIEVTTTVQTHMI